MIYGLLHMINHILQIKLPDYDLQTYGILGCALYIWAMLCVYIQNCIAHRGSLLIFIQFLIYSWWTLGSSSDFLYCLWPWLSCCTVCPCFQCQKLSVCYPVRAEFCWAVDTTAIGFDFTGLFSWQTFWDYWGRIFYGPDSFPVTQIWPRFG